MELFEELRIPVGPFFVRLDVRKASKSLRRWDYEFHNRMLRSFYTLRSRGLPAYMAFAISDEISILFGDFFSRRLEKIVSLVSSIVSINLGLAVDARIVYTPSLLSAIKYLETRQVLGYRNALIKEAYERTLEKYKDVIKAREEASKPIDKLRKEYSRYIPKRALLGTVVRNNNRDTRDFRSEEGKKKLLGILKSFPLTRSESLFRSRVLRPLYFVRGFF